MAWQNASSVWAVDCGQVINGRWTVAAALFNYVSYSPVWLMIYSAIAPTGEIGM